MTRMDDDQQYVAVAVGDRDDEAARVTFALRDEDGIMRHISLTAALVLCVWVAMAGQATAQASAVNLSRGCTPMRRVRRTSRPS